MDLLDRLKLLMQKTNDSNASLARNSGIPYTTIDGLFKKGYKNAYVSTIQKLSDYFNVSIDYLIRGTSGISDEAQIIASKYDKLGEHGKKVVNAIIELEVAHEYQIHKNQNSVHTPAHTEIAAWENEGFLQEEPAN